MKRGTIHIGTSGWKYKHWNGVFYPNALKQKDQLEYYYGIFNTVELNNSFYREPTILNYKKWKEEVPTRFSYAVKANRYFTHMKKLKVEEHEIVSFLEKASQLSEKLGPILFQFPPKWNVNVERLSSFLNLLPKKHRYALEFRNTTWYCNEVYDLLKKHNIAFCIYELDGHISPLNITASFVYIRLHGPGNGL